MPEATGLPPPAYPYQAVPASVHMARVAPGSVVLILDTPVGRSVTFWTDEDLEKLCRRLLRALGKNPDQLVVAGLDALPGFVPPPGAGDG